MKAARVLFVLFVLFVVTLAIVKFLFVKLLVLAFWIGIIALAVYILSAILKKT